jgi:hypothetical protein
MDGTLLSASRAVISNCLAHFRNATGLIYDHSDGAMVLAHEVSQLDRKTPVVVVCGQDDGSDYLQDAEHHLKRLGLRNLSRIHLPRSPVRRLDTAPLKAPGLTFTDEAQRESALRNFDAVLFHPGKFVQTSPRSANVILWREPNIGFAPLIHWTQGELAAQARLVGPQRQAGFRLSLATCNGERVAAPFADPAFSF